MIITIIDNFTTIEEAMAFDIRDEDAKPFMDALFNLINSVQWKKHADSVGRLFSAELSKQIADGERKRRENRFLRNFG